MHADEIEVDDTLVARLLATQFPELAPDPRTRPLQRVMTWGTDHAVFRLGAELSVRLPKIGWADGQGVRERRWLAVLARTLTATVAIPVALGEPAFGYPFRWYVTQWLDGENPDPRDEAAMHDLAGDLAGFVTSLRCCPTRGAPPVRRGRRGGPLAAADVATREAAERLRGTPDPTTGTEVDVDALLAIWEAGVGAVPWAGPPMWVHGDLSDGNLLTDGRRLTGVIDWSGLAGGDPAVDLMPAWTTFDPESRRTYLERLREAELTSCDYDAQIRGRAWAVSAAVQALPYYRDTNPDIVGRSWRTVRAVLSDPDPIPTDEQRLDGSGGRSAE